MSSVGGRSPRYLFLMRHAEHRGGPLTENGSQHVRALAGRLSEWIQAEWRNEPHFAIRLWYTSSAVEVRQTADLLAQAVLTKTQGRKSPANYPFHGSDTVDAAAKATNASSSRRVRIAKILPDAAILDDNTAGPALTIERDLAAYSPRQDAFSALVRWLTCSTHGSGRARLEEHDFPLLVGNDPLIGWLATKLTGRLVAVGRGELVCLVNEQTGREGWRLLWTISEDGEAAADAIRAKIKSKMTTAAALGTVIVGLTTFLLQNALQKQPTVWQWWAFAALGSSAALYFAALFLYDSLQMPPRFWGSRFPTGAPGKVLRGPRARLRHGRSSLQRPPTSTARVLQSNMVQIWTWIFTPATVIAGVGILLLALGASETINSEVVDVQPWHVLTVTAGLVVVVATWVAWQRPNLGTSD